MMNMPYSYIYTTNEDLLTIQSQIYVFLYLTILLEPISFLFIIPWYILSVSFFVTFALYIQGRALEQLIFLRM